MSDRKFKFVSPGIFIDEIDRSQIPNAPSKMGPIIIGRTARGPAMRPVTVQSYSEFVETFGDPIPGGKGGDVWRDGNRTSPTYASYAAQAYLKNSNPVTMIRLLGTEHADPDTGGTAGWETDKVIGSSATVNGGAYGLFVANSGSDQGTLAAVWYLNQGSMFLKGDCDSVVGAVSSNSVMVESVADGTFRAVIRNAADNADELDASFNFNPTSDRFIRKVFNTDPTLVNTEVTPTLDTTNYWLGQSYDRAAQTAMSASAAGKQWGMILAIGNGTVEYSTNSKATVASRTGWFIAQDQRGAGTAAALGDYDAEEMRKLFRLISLDDGEWNQNNIKISIEDVKAPHTAAQQFGSFSVVLRKITDSDKSPQPIERYTGCTMDATSPDFVGRRIGTQYTTWDTTNKRLVLHGDYANVSRFVRVEMTDASFDDADVPVGVLGPLRPKSVAWLSSSATEPEDAMVEGASAKISQYNPPGTFGEHWAHIVSTHSYFRFDFPTVPLRVSSSDGGVTTARRAYFGVDTSRSGSSVRFEKSNRDLVRCLPGQTNDTFENTTLYENSWAFSLDDIVYAPRWDEKSPTGIYAYEEGSRAAGKSVTAMFGSNYLLATKGINKFTTLLHGGFDGLDITEKEPFRNSLLDSTTTEKTSYTYTTLRRAIDTASDPDFVECNLMTIPGVWDAQVTDHLIATCEERADALAVIDIENDYIPAAETNTDSSTRVGDVDQAVQTIDDRDIDSSYACAYYPWVQSRDTKTGTMVWLPPSVAALGAMAFGDKNAAVWFAPAGFTRGGLTNGAGGLDIVGVRQQLTSQMRDDLYEAGINPIASFPAEGIVIFGQKTLQANQSALDRINVRRLLIFLKKEVSRIASTTLFTQNVESTWTSFSIRVSNFLENVKAQLGLVDFKVVLDETTTTPDLVDRNILYAKIFLKPARSIEFIALDFIITNSGASFED